MTAARRRVAGAALALAAALSPLVAVALPAVAADRTTSGAAATPAPTSTGTALTVEIGAITPAVLHPGEDLSVTATLVNRTATQLDGVVADLRLNRFRSASRDDLDAWVAGSGGPTDSRVAVAAPVSVPAGGSVTVQLALAAANVRLSDLPGTWGPRGLAVEAVGADGSRLGIQRTFLLWMRDEVVPQVRVAVVAPVTGPATDATLEQATGPGGRLRALADLATSDPDVELAVDPALVAAASTGGAHAKAWAADLTADLARRDTFALPWGDTDLSAVAHAEQPQLLSTAIALSGSSSLSGVDARTDVLWAPDGSLDQQTVDVAAAAGAHAIVVGPDTLQATDGLGTAMVDLNTGHGSLAALVPDGLLTDLLVSPDVVEPGATTATTVQRMLAELAVLAHDGSDQQHDVLIAPGRDWTPDASLADALLEALRTSPWSRLVSVSALLGADDEGAPRAALPASTVDPAELAAADVRALADAHDRTTSFAQAIGDTGTLTAGLDQRVVAPLSVAWRSHTTGRDALVQQVLADTATTRSGLSLTGPPSLNVISASAPVRFVVHNALAVPAKVAVAVTPRKACLRPARSDTVTAAPGSDTQVVVDLAAAANCEVAVEATVVGADGTAVGTAVGFSARVAPTIEDVGTVVVGVLLAIGLVLGIVRTVRRGQSARRGARVAPEDGASLPVLGGEVAAAGEPGVAPADDTTREPDKGAGAATVPAPPDDGTV
ncbi:MAG TPA: DUF6049 family protein [Cellulomonas sp.]